MSTFVLMRIFESAPERYDLAIRLLTLGRLAKAYDRLADHVSEGQRVLDLGCGTGALSLSVARRGASVKGIDIDARMLEIAERRAHEARLSGNVHFVQMGVAELDREPCESYDVVTSGLCFSELGDDELDFALKEIMRILEPGGCLLVADEIQPAGFVDRLAHRIIRAPLVFLAYLVAQRTTHPIAHLDQRLKRAGLSIDAVRYGRLGSFAEIVARKPVHGTP